MPAPLPQTAGTKRQNPRLRRKLRVIFDHDPGRRATTNNISMGGLCIASDYIALPGSDVTGAIVLRSGTRAPFAAIVRWARKIRGAATLDGTNTMGLEFTQAPGAEYAALFAEPGDAVPIAPVATGPAAPAPIASVSSAAMVAPQTAPQPSSRFSPVAWPASPVGQTDRTVATVKTADLGTSSEHYPSGISAKTAAAWIGEASTRCLAPLMPAGVDSAIIGLTLSFSHAPPVEVGTKVITTVTVSRVTAQGRAVSFEATVASADGELASGSFARILIDRGRS